LIVIKSDPRKKFKYMKIEIKIPDIAENVESGIIASILVSEGDEINEGQPVVEVETDKATTDIPSLHSGKVDELKVKEGDEVKVGQVILILEAEEEIPEEEKEEEEKDRKPEKEEEEEQEERPGEAHKGEKQEITAVSDSNIPASPSVRRLAREYGVDLRKVKGSERGNRITAEDVKAYIGRKDERAIPGAVEREAVLPDFSEWGSISRKPMENIRKITAQRMQESWRQIPHVTQFDEADISRMEEFRQQNKEKYEQMGGNLTITVILLKISAFALQKFPGFNASLDAVNSQIIYKHYCNIGVAVDTDQGLFVPVIKDVDQKSLGRLSIELTELAEKARNKKISLDELQGGNFTISNLGGIGGTGFTPIVYSPQVAILGVSRGQYKQIYQNGEFIKQLVLPLSLSYDHRVIDGAEGVRFLRWICNVLENPYEILQ